MDLFVLCREKKRMLLVNGLLLLIICILTGMTGMLVGRQYSQMEAKRWSDGKIPYHQVSVFFASGSGINTERLLEVRNNIQRSLTDASYTEQSVGGRLWIDAYAAEAKQSVLKRTDMGEAYKDNVPIMGVGGDFFQFHPLNLLSGSTFWPDEANTDLVVMEENLAWLLFGATDIAGKTIEISGKEFVIAGVYRAGNSREEKDVWEEPYLYMHYDAFKNLFEQEGMISYEAVLPNPVKGFSMQTIKNAFGEEGESLTTKKEQMVSFKDKVYIDNTERFRPLRLHKLLMAVPKLVMRTNQVSYPYWENTARMVEMQAAAMLWLREFCILLLLLYNRNAVGAVCRKAVHGFRRLPKLIGSFMLGLLEKGRQKRVKQDES